MVSIDRDIEHDGLFLGALPWVHAHDHRQGELADEEPPRSLCRCLIAPARRLDRAAGRRISGRHDDARFDDLRVRLKDRLEDAVDQGVEGGVACVEERLDERSVHGGVVDRERQVVRLCRSRDIVWDGQREQDSLRVLMGIVAGEGQREEELIDVDSVAVGTGHVT